jgi:hypothetical protein
MHSEVAQYIACSGEFLVRRVKSPRERDRPLEDQHAHPTEDLDDGPPHDEPPEDVHLYELVIDNEYAFYRPLQHNLTAEQFWHIPTRREDPAAPKEVPREELCWPQGHHEGLREGLLAAGEEGAARAQEEGGRRALLQAGQQLVQLAVVFGRRELGRAGGGCCGRGGGRVQADQDQKGLLGPDRSDGSSHAMGGEALMDFLSHVL